MATFVLVHAAYFGAWYWRDVASPLRGMGHEVWTPTLTGLGQRSHLSTKEIGLSAHIADIVQALEYEDLRDVVLIGHSYSGAVIAGVADRQADRIRRLVHLDTMIPRNGQSLFDAIGELLPGLPEKILEIVERSEPNWLIPLHAFWQAMGMDMWEGLGLSGAGCKEWVDPRLCGQPLQTYQEPLRLQSDAPTSLPRTFIGCREAPWPDGYLDGFRNDPTWDYRELPTGHMPMITAPDDLSRLLDEIA